MANDRLSVKRIENAQGQCGLRAELQGPVERS